MNRQITTILAFISLLAAVPATCQTTYTGPKPFNSAISAYSVKHTVNFDTQADGSSATNYGKLGIQASGLASDGSTAVSLTEIATANYAPHSEPNMLGVQNDLQFLSGNSDTITFNFSGPVHAFACYLIGNPSPTGVPALPFWRMHINTAAGYDAFSATDPFVSYSEGNDLYYLGVVSAEPFTQVTLYSDADPNAVFSFNVDNITYATNAKEVALASVRHQKLGTIVKVSDVIITRTHSLSRFDKRFNIEKADRQAGIVVLGNSGLSRHTAIDLTGTTTITSDGEVAITLDEILSSAISTAPGSLGMSTMALGSTNRVGAQEGIPGSIGPNNIGLDVTIWGRITEVYHDPDFLHLNSYIIVDDGSARRCGGTANTGVKVVGAVDTLNKQVGQYVIVRGSSSVWKDTRGTMFPLIRVAATEDISAGN